MSMNYEVIEQEGAARPDNTGADASKTDGSTADGSTVDDRSVSGTASTVPTPGGTSANQYSEGAGPSISYDTSVTAGTDPDASGVVPVSGTETSSWTSWDDLPHYDENGSGPLTAAQIAALDATGAGWWAAVVGADGGDRVVWTPYTTEEQFAIDGPSLVEDAAKTATSYVTEVGTGGIRVHPKDNNTDYTQIDSSGMTIYNGGAAVATFKSNQVDLARYGRSAKITMCDAAVRIESDADYTSDGRFVAESYKVDSGGNEIVDTVGNHPMAYVDVQTVSRYNADYATVLSWARNDNNSYSAQTITTSSASGASTFGYVLNTASPPTNVGRFGIGYSASTGKATFTVAADDVSFIVPTTKNYVLASPSSANGSPTFRPLVAADLPTVPVTKGGTGATTAANARTNLGITPANIGAVSNAGDTITGTLILSRTQNASGTANNSPALIVGGTATQAHLELDGNEIMAKGSGTTTATLYINNDGGLTEFGGNVCARGGNIYEKDNRLDNTASSISANSFAAIGVVDKNNQWVSFIQAGQYTGGDVHTYLTARKHINNANVDNYVRLDVMNDGTQGAYVSAPAAWRKALHVGAATISLASNAATKTSNTKVSLAGIVTSDSSLFSLSSGGIKCLVAGTVKISAQLSINGNSYNGGAALLIYKGSTAVVETIGNVSTASSTASVSFAPKCVTVAANDIIYMYARTTMATTALANSTYLTVEYIA